MFASRAWTWPRDHLCRSTIAPRRSRPTTWNAFLPMSMPIVATGEFDLLDMVVLLCFVAPSKHHSLEKREHGRTIPLAVKCTGISAPADPLIHLAYASGPKFLTFVRSSPARPLNVTTLDRKLSHGL